MHLSHRSTTNNTNFNHIVLSSNFFKIYLLSDSIDLFIASAIFLALS